MPSPVDRPYTKPSLFAFLIVLVFAIALDFSLGLLPVGSFFITAIFNLLLALELWLFNVYTGGPTARVIVYGLSVLFEAVFFPFPTNTVLTIVVYLIARRGFVRDQKKREEEGRRTE